MKLYAIRFNLIQLEISIDTLNAPKFIFNPESFNRLIENSMAVRFLELLHSIHAQGYYEHLMNENSFDGMHHLWEYRLKKEKK